MDVIAYVLITFSLSKARCRHMERVNRPIEVANGVRERSTLGKLRTAAGPLPVRATKARPFDDRTRGFYAHVAPLQEHDLLRSRPMGDIT